MAAPIIHGERLLNGERLGRCSAIAQLYYPRILLCANGYGRIEIDPRRIIDSAFRTFRIKPSEDEIADVLEEYAKNYLMCLYGRGGQFWGQFDIPDNLLPDHKTKPDQQSPAPPEGKMEAMRATWEGVKKHKSIAVSKLRALVIEGEPKSLNDLETPGNNFQLLANEVVGEVVVVGEEKKKKKHAPTVLPDWLPLEPWDAFVEMRAKGKGKALTEYGKKLIIGDLEKFRNKGHPPGPILEEAVKRGWTGVWEPRDGNHQAKGAKVFEDAFERRINANGSKLSK